MNLHCNSLCRQEINVSATQGKLKTNVGSMGNAPHNLPPIRRCLFAMSL